MTDSRRASGPSTPASASPTAGGSGTADLAGLSLRGRLGLVALGELGVAAQFWLGTRETVHVFLWLFVLTPVMVLLGLLITVQAHHRLPVAWHVVVFFGWVASLMIAPWASTLGDTTAPGGLTGGYVTGLAWFALVTIEVSCMLALVRPAGSSFISVRKGELAGGRG